MVSYSQVLHFRSNKEEVHGWFLIWFEGFRRTHFDSNFIFMGHFE